MKNLLLILCLTPFFILSQNNDKYQKDKIYGNWKAQPLIEYFEEEGMSGKVTIEITNIQFTSVGKYNTEGYMSYDFNWNDKEMTDFLGSRYDIKFMFSGTWNFDQGFLNSTFENVITAINDENEIQLINSDQLDDSGKARMELYKNLIEGSEWSDLKGTANSEEIITLNEDVMVTKDAGNTITTYTRINK